MEPPADLTTVQIAVVALCSLFLGIAKAGFAGGVGILATPLLALVVDVEFSLGFLLPLLFCADVFNFYHFWKKWEHRALKMVLPGCFIGVAAAWPLLAWFQSHEQNHSVFARAIGLIALLFASAQILREFRKDAVLPFQPTRAHGAIAGTVTGFISTLAHQGGLITQMYLVPQRLSAAAFVGTTTVIYFFVNFIKMPVYLTQELIRGSTLWWSLYNLPLVFLGTAIGAFLNKRMSGKLFNRIIIVFVLITAIRLLWKG